MKETFSGSTSFRIYFDCGFLAEAQYINFPNSSAQQESLVCPRSNERGTQKKKVNPRRLQGTTNFYPTYVDGNKDKVTPVGAARRTDFQTVLPLYPFHDGNPERRDWPNFLKLNRSSAYRRNAEPKRLKYLFKRAPL